ncbi:outer membrane protein assembly factor BamA [Erythrobacter arachoides]|uniref:Outer membrane protein assembly factor BamA n=1 Tax=Aurantiacibacter arachoides TaxID=1850444 RepID=A0A845A0B5_9SPHN|nr:outer membrane protein assembly factor BamA [Aurantiacibacter arachoides]MXO92912.1 outer membrane protein assembly factor BamA [Aurantiacibacter arachoides]GGD53476.1 outer membrane protein assembly factor BamA [Aurantiacibacter arachoides]
MGSRARTISASHYAAALLGCTMLAGLPTAAMAQDGDAAAAQQQAQPAPAPAATPAPAASQQGTVIRTIAVAGAQRLEPETIVSYIQLRPGMVYTAAAADQALIDLANTELFADFRIDFNDATGALTIAVEENPIINRVLLEGNRRLENDEISEEINLRPRQIFTRSRVRADVARIIELYKRQGRFAATVEPQMVMLDQNRVDVIFEISEGPKSKVRQINIIGNEVFPDSQLRSEMLTREDSLLSFFSSNTSYDPDRMAYDQQLLRQYYLTQGYADFRVISAVAELTPDRRDFIITYVVEEGERYKFGDVEVVSQLRDFQSDVLTQQLTIATGDWYNAERVDQIEEGLTETAGAFGYAFADVRPRIVRNAEDRTMDVTFTISDAPRVYVEAIEVNGNTLTQDKVIRREFRIAEGDAFSTLQVARTTARINSLGYFQENFEVTQVEGSSPDRIILQANVQEEPTGQLSLSAGFSSLESFIFNGSIQQNNFRGRGQTIGLGINYSRYSRSANISFTEPKVFDRDIAVGADIYRNEYNNGYFDRDSATYEQTTTGFGVRVGVPLSEYINLLGRYTLNYQQITVDETQFFADFDGDGVSQCEPLIAGRYLCDALGNRLQSILGASFNYNTLNSRQRPTAGTNASLSFDIAGLGGDTQYARARLNAARYWNLGAGFIGSVSIEGGYIYGWGDEDVLLTDRFFLGEGQMRGFDVRGIGPRVIRRFYVDENADGAIDAADLLPLGDDRNQDDSLGGNAYYLARAEVEIPLGSGARNLGLRPSVFVDVGSVFNVTRPQLTESPLPDGLFIPQRDGSGNPLFLQPTRDASGAITGTTLVISPIGPDGSTNQPVGQALPPFIEEFVGDTPSPRVSAGIGVNWNSPFGPFRIDLAYALLKERGDETKLFSFNVGTQF